jgi:glycerol-3-phosphate acyltransferase PlsX
VKIALDAMGGDYAPMNPVEGAVMAARELNIGVILIGQEESIKEQLKNFDISQLPIEIEPAQDIVEMHETAINALKKKHSSLRIAAELVKEGKAQGLVSAGHTGATMAVAKIVLGALEGIDRPALAMIVPTPKGSALLLDVGANVDCKPHNIWQFAIIGHTFANKILNIPQPKVGLISIGEEENKGNELTRESYKFLKMTPINFAGNIEGRDVFSGKVDVSVCDGFVGNVILKVSESIAETMAFLLKDELSRNFLGKLGYFFCRDAYKKFQKRTDYAEYGGALLLGLKDICVICHGRSSPKAIKNALNIAKDFYLSKVNNKICNQISQLSKTHNFKGVIKDE